VAALYGLATSTAPFQSILTTAPNDWTVAVSYTGGGLNVDNIPQAVAIDGAGDVWVASQDGPVVKLSSSGAILSGANGFTDGNQRGTLSIAIDLSGNAWVANSFTDSVSKFSSSGSVLSGSSGFSVAGGPENGPWTVAIDASNDAWIGPPGLFKLSNDGTNLSGPSGYSGGGLGTPFQIAFDGAGNAWVGNYGPNVTELSSSGTILSGANGYATGGEQGVGIALDSAGNVWTATRSTSIYAASGITKFSNSGSVLIAAPPADPGSNPWHPYGLTLDGAGNAWVTSYSGDSCCILEFSNSGTLLSPKRGYASGIVLGFVEGIAVDGSGNIWVANQGGSVSELVGAGVPVITPIAAGLPAIPTADGSSNLATRP
jgi:hypothetical protein